jgi:glycosyltransferase involved in cell wall biosynthesis
VAILSTWHPEPADNGRKQRTRRMIEALAPEFDIALVSLLPPEQCNADLPPVPGVRSQYALPLPTFAPRSPRALAALWGGMPRSLAATWDAATAAALVGLVRRERIGLAIGTDLRTLRYLLALGRDIRTVLDEPDVSPFVVAPGDRSRGLAGMRARARERKYRCFLRQAAARLDATIVASPEEARAYQVLSDLSGAVVLENGVAAVPEVPWSPPRSGRLIYTGSLSYGPNAEAITYFVRAILPQVAESVPEVRLDVTGALPSVVPPEARDPRVALTGRLDVEAFDACLRGAAACVIPLLSGTGTRIKLLEALALGMPVVSTRKGAEGLCLRDGEHLLIADGPADFAAATIRVLRDDKLAASLGAQGREAIQTRYDWGVIGGRLRALVRILLDGAQPALDQGGVHPIVELS